MAVIDAILYNGEREIFDLRYNILKDYVDEFVVVEFGKTFSGKYKVANPINLPKVSYYFITEWEELKPDMPEAFQREYSQRETIKTKLTHLQDDDVVFMGDCDEIWRGAAVYLGIHKDWPRKLHQRMYTYYLNNRTSEDWWGTSVAKYSWIKEHNLNDLRTQATPLKATEGFDDYFGWHFTNMGGLDKLKYKIESYGHQEFNTPEVKDNLEQRMKENQDYIGRGFKMWVDESDWPPWLKENRELYINMLKND